MPTNPLTPTEHAEVNAALETVKLSLDGERLNDIERLDKYRKFYKLGTLKTFSRALKADNLEQSNAHRIAAELLASQMAGRLAGVTQ